MAAISTLLALLAPVTLAQPQQLTLAEPQHRAMAEPKTERAKLTALGAHQLYEQGAAFRNRYVRPSRHEDFVGLVGIDPKTIDNSQLYVESSTDECSADSALAFMQGLYPPWPYTTCDLGIPDHIKTGNGSILNYPLCGYQYPNIRTISPENDQDAIWSHGHHMCKKHEDSLQAFPNNPEADSIYQQTKAFYSGLWDKIFCDAFLPSQCNFYHAHELYEYALYRWNHDERSHALITHGELEQLQELAWHEQVLKHAVPTTGPEGEDDKSSCIAARTLATRVFGQFSENVESCGKHNKLNLAFTSHEPFLAFFALANPDGAEFSRLPEPGAALIFELFSVDSILADRYGLPESSSNYESYSDAGCCDNTSCNHGSCNLDSGNDKSPKNNFGGDDRGNQAPISHGGPPISHGDASFSHGDGSISHGGHGPGSFGPFRRRQLGGGGIGGSGNEKAASYNNVPLHQVPIKSFPTIGDQGDDHAFCPSPEQLYVRVLYRPSTEPHSPAVPVPLFGNQSTMPYKHFSEAMQSVGVQDATHWCNLCESGPDKGGPGFCIIVSTVIVDDEHHVALILGLSGAGLAIALAFVVGLLL
ncbi:phosphoglycerate mutase-like protein [Parathielavia hyrcaniae]|uniref:Phosphoglycerate mutase-like protein n=1 Tax=Parathielavia hyrcaniae TaxID=113614 RepID=A0AAN6Q1C5_9PEZI|nr:phosphoglycerate mutase-like protein [Parathielavia hyrcaniae]